MQIDKKSLHPKHFLYEMRTCSAPDALDTQDSPLAAAAVGSTAGKGADVC
jgi:hypothetical protein